VSRLYLYGGIALVILLVGFAAGWQIQGWRAGAARSAAVEAALAGERKATQNVIDTLKSDIRTSQERSNALQAELTRLRNAAALQPIPPVRLCKPARSAPTDLPAASTTASGPDSGTSAGGLVQADPVGGDLAPTLELLVEEGDRCSAQLRALIGWVESTR